MGLSLGKGDTGHPVIDAAALFTEHTELLQRGVLPCILIGVLRGEHRDQLGWPLDADWGQECVGTGGVHSPR